MHFNCLLIYMENQSQVSGTKKKKKAKCCLLQFLPKYHFCNWLHAYGKYPKISNNKASDKMAYANSADPDQTAPEGAVWLGSTLFVIPLQILRSNGISNYQI